MSVKTIEILEQLKSLTPSETSELVKQIEETFNVDTSPSFICSTFIDQGDASKDELPVQTEFDVVLDVVPADKKIAILKVIRTLTGLALKEVKEFVESVPQVVKSSIALATAEDIKQQLEAAGAIVSLV
ncbi:MAG: 50S ribosomal protein L7/L12 [Potamolinea sp.]